MWVVIFLLAIIFLLCKVLVENQKNLKIKQIIEEYDLKIENKLKPLIKICDKKNIILLHENKIIIYDFNFNEIFAHPYNTVIEINKIISIKISMFFEIVYEDENGKENNVKVKLFNNENFYKCQTLIYETVKQYGEANILYYINEEYIKLYDDKLLIKTGNRKIKNIKLNELEKFQIVEKSFMYELYIYSKNAKDVLNILIGYIPYIKYLENKIFNEKNKYNLINNDLVMVLLGIDNYLAVYKSEIHIKSRNNSSYVIKIPLIKIVKLEIIEQKLKKYLKIICKNENSVYDLETFEEYTVSFNNLAVINELLMELKQKIENKDQNFYDVNYNVNQESNELIESESLKENFTWEFDELMQSEENDNNNEQTFYDIDRELELESDESEHFETDEEDDDDFETGVRQEIEDNKKDIKIEILEVTLKKLNLEIVNYNLNYDEDSISFIFEICSTSSEIDKKTLDYSVKVNLYDVSGKIIDSSSAYIGDSFEGYDVFKVDFYNVKTSRVNNAKVYFSKGY
ncbi:hypothetical protein [Caviibacter abscessus]|uniref:hypothetical protein n=1 Tax=Caviibacter abscessus TaxID=1766719 RepID=UPI000837C5EE|nr:hypothetical protein [Caviibacter abscessus]